MPQWACRIALELGVPTAIGGAARYVHDMAMGMGLAEEDQVPASSRWSRPPALRRGGKRRVEIGSPFGPAAAGRFCSKLVIAGQPIDRPFIVQVIVRRRHPGDPAPLEVKISRSPGLDLRMP